MAMLPQPTLQTCRRRSIQHCARRRLVLSAVLLIVGTTSACAPSSRIEVVEAGRTPVSAPQTYVLSLPETATADERKAAQAIERQLNARPWSTASSAPGLKVETAYVVRSESVGVARHEDETEVWLVQPERRVWWRRKSNIHALSVRLVQPATGEEFARATARVHLSGPMNDSLMDSLASAAVSRMMDGVTAPF